MWVFGKGHLITSCCQEEPKWNTELQWFQWWDHRSEELYTQSFEIHEYKLHNITLSCNIKYVSVISKVLIAWENDYIFYYILIIYIIKFPIYIVIGNLIWKLTFKTQDFELKFYFRMKPGYLGDNDNFPQIY